MLSIAGDNFQFTPILPYFRHWGDEPRPPFCSGEQIKWRPNKKKVFTKNETLFSPNSSGHLRSDAHQSQLIGGDVDVDHTQIIGGIQSNYWMGYIPHPPGFRHPCLKQSIGFCFVKICISFENLRCIVFQKPLWKVFCDVTAATTIGQFLYFHFEASLCDSIYVYAKQKSKEKKTSCKFQDNIILRFSFHEFLRFVELWCKLICFCLLFMLCQISILFTINIQV